MTNQLLRFTDLKCSSLVPNLAFRVAVSNELDEDNGLQVLFEAGDGFTEAESLCNGLEGDFKLFQPRNNLDMFAVVEAAVELQDTEPIDFGKGKFWVGLEVAVVGEGMTPSTFQYLDSTDTTFFDAINVFPWEKNEPGNKDDCVTMGNGFSEKLEWKTEACNKDDRGVWCFTTCPDFVGAGDDYTPTQNPTQNPSRSPTLNPSRSPTRSPTLNPTENPTRFNETDQPTRSPTDLENADLDENNGNGNNSGAFYILFVILLSATIIVLTYVAYQAKKLHSDVGLIELKRNKRVEIRNRVRSASNLVE